MTDLTTAIDNEDDAEENGQGATPRRQSLRSLINQHCKDCCYDPEVKGSGTWRAQTEACAVTKCALWPVRPVSKPRKVKDEECGGEE